MPALLEADPTSETQPEFAIRFHEAHRNDIPDAYARNAACDQQWEAACGGDMPERVHAQELHTPDKYQEARDVVVFMEHEVPDSVAPDGSAIPGAYDKYALAAMCNRMNAGLRETDQCSPLSLGHTERGKPEPELLGYAGAMRLGQIGRDKQQWAILTDEYRLASKAQRFAELPGRSPEVWKYPRFEDRFFAPIACLGTTTPRLPLPPAKYSHATMPDGVDIPVDRYHRQIDETTFDDDEVEIDSYMSFMGMANAFPPSHAGRDQYGDDEGRESGGGIDLSSADGVGQLIDALMNTQPMQWVMQQMAKEHSGFPQPSVQQPPEPADVKPAVPGGNPNQAGFPPQQGMQMAQQYSKPAEQIERLTTENAQLRERIEKLETDRTRDHYSRRIDDLARTHILNPEAELTRVMALPAEQRDGHIEVIRDNYQRLPTEVEEFNVHRPDGAGPADRAPAQGSAEEEQLAERVAQYAMEHQISFVEARERYSREHAAA